MNHPDYDALLAGVLADPDADLPRLVLADWLEETGEPANCARAKYIRASIDYEQNKPPPAGRRTAVAGLGRLKAAFKDEWDVFRQPSSVMGYATAARRRGFVDVVHLGVVNSLYVCEELNARHPVRHLYVSTPHVRPGVLASPRIDSVQLIAFHGYDYWGVLEFLNRAWLPSLKRLSASRCGLSDGHVVRLTQMLRENASFRNIETLNISRNHLTDHAAHALAAADLPPTLRRLNIEGTRITNAGREVLFRRFGFEELRPRLALG